MKDLNSIIKFYRDCYQLELKGIRIKNFLSTKCEKRLIPDNNDAFLSNHSQIPVPTKWGAEVEKKLLLNAREKTLYAGSVFIKGKQSVLGSKSNAYVPLYIHELSLTVEDEVFYISIVETYFNPDFVETANGIDGKLNLSLDMLSREVPSKPFGFDNHVLLETFFNKYFDAWDIEDLANYRQQDFNYKKYFEATKTIEVNTSKVLSCFMIGIFKKSEGAMGILEELNQLAELKIDSNIFDIFFQFKNSEPRALVKRNIFLPTILSSIQEFAFYAADAFKISQIIGPPGTGKSYTIAALAIDAISNNKSVLIVTRNPQACKVIVNKIEHDFKVASMIVKAYNQVYKRSLISKLKKVVLKTNVNAIHPKKLENKITKIIGEIKILETKILNMESEELKWGAFYANNQKGFFTIFKDRWFQYLKRNIKPVSELIKELRELRNQKIVFVRRYIKIKMQYNLHMLKKKSNADFWSLFDNLKEKNRTIKDEQLNTIDFKLILEALPLWASTTKEISKALPLKKGLFDFVIFDESSQCDIASVLPVLYRAKKVIVVGDPHQLRHISFLSDKKQDELKSKYSIKKDIPDYRRDSLINWTNHILTNTDQVTFLSEHYRSKTHIIQFSNQRFYDNQLKIIRSNPIQDATSSIEIQQTPGQRNDKGINEVEADLLIDRVINLFLEFEAQDEVFLPTIGILSPFTEQVKILRKKLSLKAKTENLKRHKLLVGTPFHFQGEEKDIILVSFVIDKDAHFAAINYLNKKDVFNVLMTRAKNEMIIYTSVKSKDLPTNSLLREYLEMKTNQQPNHVSDSVRDLFFEQVSLFLKEGGYNVLFENKIVTGVEVDLVVLNKNKLHCIDLIGFPGPYQNQFSLEHLKILSRMNIPIFFLTYSSWHLEEEKTKKKLLAFIKEDQ